jgi:eukaryotic-like serine/threonine-protein kinase
MNQGISMTSADVFAQIEKMGQLPSLPQTLLHVQSVASDERSSAEDLAVCILKDQALTMRVLKVVNSAMYQRRSQERVHTVRKAVIVMGFETVRKLALGLSVFDMMSKLSRSPWLAHIANHSLMTAAFAQILAEASGSTKPEEAFVAALVHDIGKIVLLECSPAAMDAVLDDRAGGGGALEAERRHFGITHDRAGRRLAARWDLPPQIQNVIGDHHDIDPLTPPRNLDPLLGTIVYANAMSRFNGLPGSQDEEYKILRKATRKLGIPAARMDQVHKQVSEAVDDLAACFGVEIGDLHQYGQLVNVKGGVNVGPRRLSPEELARRTADQLELYQAIGTGLASGANPDELIQKILRGSVDILGFERVILLHVDRSEHRLVARAWAGIEAEILAPRLEFPLKRSAGALAMAVLEHRAIHVPDAHNTAYGDLVGDHLLAVADCTGFAVTPVYKAGQLEAVIYADCGPDGDDVTAEQSSELGGLAVQAGLVLGAAQSQPTI